LNILLVPTTDWLGHPFPSRLHHILDKVAEHNEVHVIRFSFYNDKKLDTKAIVHEINDIRISNLPLYYSLNGRRHYKAVRKIIKENKIDVAIVSNLLAGYIASASIDNRIPIIFDLSDHFPSSGAGYYFDLNSSLGKMATFILEKLLEMSLKKASLTVTCSQMLRRYVRRLGVKNVEVIPNGVSSFFFYGNCDPQFIRDEYDLNGVVVGYIGSIEFWLNLHPLLESISQLTKSFDIKLLLVGSKLRTATAGKIHKEIERLGIGKYIVWLDFIPYPEVPNFISAMDICTIPFNHNFATAYYSAPNKLLEYLALGKTVISTPIPEIILTAKDYVFFAETSEDYSRTIKDYINEADKYAEIARRGVKFASQLTWEKIADKYEEILNKL